MTSVDVTIVGSAVSVRDDGRVVVWREPRFDRFASASARMLVDAVESAWPHRDSASDDRVGVYLATGETGLDVDAFLAAAHVAWDARPDDPDYRWMGGRALRAIDPYYSLRTLANGPAALLAMHLDARGPSLNVAQQAHGVAWALVAALDDLDTSRCGVAVVGACDVPSVPIRLALARTGAQAQGLDEAVVLVLRRAPAGRGAAGSLAVRWERVAADGADECPVPVGSVVAPLRALVAQGRRDGWTSAFQCVMDAGDGARVVVDFGV